MKEWELAEYVLLKTTCNDCVFASVWPSDVWENCPYRLARRASFENGSFLPPKQHDICELFSPVESP